MIRRWNWRSDRPGHRRGADVPSALVLTGRPAPSGTAGVRRDGRPSPPCTRPSICQRREAPHAAVGLSPRLCRGVSAPAWVRGQAGGAGAGVFQRNLLKPGGSGTVSWDVTCGCCPEHPCVGSPCDLGFPMASRGGTSSRHGRGLPHGMGGTSPQHGGLLVGQTSYTGLGASGVSVPANEAEAAPHL